MSLTYAIIGFLTLIYLAHMIETNARQSEKKIVEELRTLRTKINEISRELDTTKNILDKTGDRVYEMHSRLIPSNFDENDD